MYDRLYASVIANICRRFLNARPRFEGRTQNNTLLDGFGGKRTPMKSYIPSRNLCATSCDGICVQWDTTGPGVKGDCGIAHTGMVAYHIVVSSRDNDSSEAAYFL